MQTKFPPNFPKRVSTRRLSPGAQHLEIPFDLAAYVRELCGPEDRTRFTGTILVDVRAEATGLPAAQVPRVTLQWRTIGMVW